MAQEDSQRPAQVFAISELEREHALDRTSQAGVNTLTTLKIRVYGKEVHEQEAATANAAARAEEKARAAARIEENHLCVMIRPTEIEAGPRTGTKAKATEIARPQESRRQEPKDRASVLSGIRMLAEMERIFPLTMRQIARHGNRDIAPKANLARTGTKCRRPSQHQKRKMIKRIRSRRSRRRQELPANEG